MLMPIDAGKGGRRAQPTSTVPAVVNTYAVPAFGGDSGDPAGGLQSLTGLLLRRKWTITAAAICGLLIGAIVSALSDPVYRARASLQLEGFNDQALHEITPVSPLPNASPEDYLQNNVKVLESDTLARRVVTQLGPVSEDKPGALMIQLSRLKRALGFGSKPQVRDPQKLSEQRMRSVKNAISVHTSLQSQVIEVYFDAPNPTLAARGANAAVTEFMNLNQEARWQLVQDTTEWLNRQAVELKAKLESSSQRLQDFTARNGLVLAGKENTPAQERMRQLQDALTRAEADRAAKQARYDAAVANPDNIMTDVLASGPLRQYETDLQNLRRQLADLRTIYTPDNYRITRLEAQVSETEAAVKKERKDVLDRIHSDYIAAASLEGMLSTSLTRQLAELGQQTEKELQYNVLKNELDTNQKLYDSVLERSKEAGAASSLRMTNVRVIDPAVPPPAPYSPDVPLNLALGLAIGTLGGAGLVLLGARPGKIKQPGELRSLNIPELGVVPSASRNLAIASGDRAALGDQFDSSLLRESFRAVLTSILLSTEPREGRKNGGSHRRAVVVTSVDMMEGKTAVVTNLGIASAQHKGKILLIDADLRRPRLHERFGLPNDSGLTNLLENIGPGEARGYSSPEGLVQPTQFPNLWVLTSGPVDAASANILYSPALSTLLRRFERRFDMILIDAPPMSMYSDARVLGRTADGVVMVVRANTKSREELRAAYEKLLQDRIHVLGTILNDWKIERSQARAYARYYHHYQQRENRAI